MRTTLTLDDDVAARLNQMRKLRDQSLKELVNDLLRQALKEMNKPSKPGRVHRTRSVSLGRCLVGNVDDVSEVLAVTEGEDFK